MTESFERLWVSWLNSNRWRRFAKGGPGSKFFRSKAYVRLNMTRRYVTTYYYSRKHPTLFQDVKRFCMFVGHAKSGGTLIGSLLDAHPNIILADEADVFHYVAHGFSRDQIYHLLLKASRRERLKGRVTARRLKPYSFLIPGQWQGRYRRLRVIGDSKAGPSTRKLGRDLTFLQRLRQVMAGSEVKIIHVIRNPYDPISLMMIRGKRTFENATAHYFAYCETLAAVRKQMDRSDLLAVRYEDFIHQPGQNLRQICRFLGVEAGDDYLQACSDILYPSPEQSRHQVAWSPEWIQVVADKIEQFDFLAGYTFEGQEQDTPLQTTAE